MRRVEFVPLFIRENAEIFTIRIENEDKTEFGKVLKVMRIMTEKGISESLFRNEGSIMDRVCAIPIYCMPRNFHKHGTLRLYCIRISDKPLITGTAGIKKTRTYEEDPSLMKSVRTMQKIDNEIYGLEEDGYNIEKEIYNLMIDID